MKKDDDAHIEIFEDYDVLESAQSLLNGSMHHLKLAHYFEDLGNHSIKDDHREFLHHFCTLLLDHQLEVLFAIVENFLVIFAVFLEHFGGCLPRLESCSCLILAEAHHGD